MPSDLYLLVIQSLFTPGIKIPICLGIGFFLRDRPAGYWISALIGFLVLSQLLLAGKEAHFPRWGFVSACAFCFGGIAWWALGQFLYQTLKPSHSKQKRIFLFIGIAILTPLFLIGAVMLVVSSFSALVGFASR